MTGAQTVSLVSILPALDVFLLHPPVVVNGGTHASTTQPSTSSKDGYGAGNTRDVTSIPAPATPDLIATPDVLSPEGKSGDDALNNAESVEGKDNCNFVGKLRHFCLDGVHCQRR